MGFIGIPEGRRPSFYLPRSSMKSNPYVGSFRHAPALNERQYAGFSQKACNSVSPSYSTELCTDAMTKFVQALVLNSTVCGNLPGGRPALINTIASNPILAPPRAGNAPQPRTWRDDRINNPTGRVIAAPRLNAGAGTGTLSPAFRAIRDLQNNLASQSALYSILTIRVPSLLSSILLAGENQNNMPTLSLVPEEMDKSYDSGPGGDDEYSDYSGIYASTETTSSSCAKQVYSPLSAELYDDYANRMQALMEILRTSPSSPDLLDFVITRSDVSRLARSASKHLDVASILSLPTTTYRPPPPKTVIIKKELDGEKGEAATDEQKLSINESASTEDMNFSWMMVSPEGNGDNEGVSYPEGDECPDLDERDWQDQQDCCVICLENFVDGDTLRVLPCSHLFHTGCIDHWLLGTYSHFECETTGCPMCKKRAISEAGEVPHADGCVPSWAFAQLGDALAKQESFHSARNFDHYAQLSKDDSSFPSSVSLSS